MWATQSGFKYLPKRLPVPLAPTIDPPVFSSPGSRIKTSDTTDHKAVSRFVAKARLKVVEEKARRYNQASVLSQLHEPIVSAIKRMPKSVVNYLNINHYQSELERTREKDVLKLERELEYELLQSLQVIEEEVVKKLFETEVYSLRKDSIAKRFSRTDHDYNVKVNFKLPMAPFAIETLNECVHKIISLLYIERPKMAVSMENIWKLLVLIIDNLLQFTYDQNNNYIKETTAETLEQLDMQTKNVRALEEKLFQLQRQHQDELQNERFRFYQLQEQFEKLSSDYTDIQRLRDEDVKTVANGGVYYLKKSLIQLDEALRGFTGETDRGTKEIQQGLRKVASTMVCRNKAGDLAISRIRSVLGIDILKQPAGDLALGHLFSEHPWMPLLQLKNLIKTSFRIKEEFQETKLTLFHRIMQAPRLPFTSASRQLLEMLQDKNFHYMVRCLVVIINPASEQTNLTVHVNTMVGRVFGIFGMEGLELMDLNRIRELYSAIMEYFNATQQSIRVSETPVERPESSNTIRRIIMMNIQQPTSLLTFKFSRKHFDLIVGVMITRIFPESIAILEVLARKFDEKKEMTFSAILLELFDILGKSSVRYFKEKCNLLKDKLKLTKNQEDFIMKSVALEIADGIFSRYPAIDVVKVWHYLIWRYYIVFEKQLKFDPTMTDIEDDDLYVLNNEYRPSIFGQVSIDNVIEQFMVDSVQRIRAMLIFNPLSFCVAEGKQARLSREASVEGSISSVDSPTQKFDKQVQKKRMSDDGQDHFD